MPTYLDLLQKRVATQARRHARINVCLDPEMITELDEARQTLAAEQRQIAPDEVRVKMNGGTLQAARDRVANLEQQVRETTLVVVIQALSDVQELSAEAVKDEANMAPFLRRRLELAFLRAETWNGEPVPDITADHWTQILEVTPPGELAYWSQQLNRVGQAPDFPTSAK